MGWLQDWSGSWHDFWEIIGAIATAAAVIVALWSSHREAAGRKRAELRAEAAEGARDAERERADAARAARETTAREVQHRAQAFQVIAWLEHRNATSERFDESDRRLPEEHLIRFVNTSSAPVFDVKFHVFETERNNQIDIGSRVLLPAGADGGYLLTNDLQIIGHRLGGVISFRDLHGTNWRRYENGHLAEHDKFGQVVWSSD